MPVKINTLLETSEDRFVATAKQWLEKLPKDNVVMIDELAGGLQKSVGTVHRIAKALETDGYSIRLQQIGAVKRFYGSKETISAMRSNPKFKTRLRD